VLHSKHANAGPSAATLIANAATSMRDEVRWSTALVGTGHVNQFVSLHDASCWQPNAVRLQYGEQ
jgi:hypothetical protein